jgi:hypothetical protein
MHTLVVVLFYIWMIGGRFLVYGYPFYVVFRGGSLKKGVLLTWGFMVLYNVISSIPFFAFIEKYAYELLDYVPEGNSIIASLVTGCFFGLIISFLAYICRWIFDLIRKKIPNGTKSS